MAQTLGVLEPIYNVRRNLFQIEGKLNDNEIGKNLFKICKLARQSGHLHLVESYLLECRKFSTNTNFETIVDLEESKYYFKKVIILYNMHYYMLGQFNSSN